MQTLLLKLILLESEALRFNRVPQNFFGGYRVPIAKKRLRTTAIDTQLGTIPLLSFVLEQMVSRR